MNLRELQQSFKETISNWHQSDFRDSILKKAAIKSDPNYSDTFRVGVYADAFIIRISGAIAKDFSEVAGLISGDEFEKLCSEFVNAYPSTSAQLEELSFKFPEFLSQHPIREKFPYISDLAQMELEQILILQKNTTVPKFDLALIGQLGERELERVKLVLNPLNFRFSSRWNLISNPIIEKPTELLIWAANEKTYIETLSPLTKEVIERIRAGKSLPEITQGIDATPDFFSECFLNWSQSHLISKFILS